MTKPSGTRTSRGRSRWPWVALVGFACGHTSEPPPRAVETQGQASAAPVARDAGLGEKEGADASAPDDPTPLDAAAEADGSPPLPTPGSPKPPEISSKRAARCQRDAECAIETVYDCCGGCPSSPVSAISAAANRKSAARLNRMCAVIDMDCSMPRCTPLPSGCRFGAVCRKGWCEVNATAGCSE
ncbi:MAG: hypothetical protein IPI67_26355 [Myxococcales bacterium]|nr:hypothetical protein [Myxococcales bacterium]